MNDIEFGGNFMNEMLKLKNKDFAFRCLEALIKSPNLTDEKVLKLTNRAFCKDKFDMNYSILQEVNLTGSIHNDMFNDHAGNRRYYPNTILIKGKRYIVCNDWYYGSTRDTRTEFLKWCMN